MIYSIRQTCFTVIPGLWRSPIEHTTGRVVYRGAYKQNKKGVPLFRLTTKNFLKGETL